MKVYGVHTDPWDFFLMFDSDYFLPLLINSVKYFFTFYYYYY